MPDDECVLTGCAGGAPVGVFCASADAEEGTGARQLTQIVEVHHREVRLTAASLGASVVHDRSQ